LKNSNCTINKKKFEHFKFIKKEKKKKEIDGWYLVLF